MFQSNVFAGTFTGTPIFTAPTSTAGVLETVAHSSRADPSTLKVLLFYAEFFLPFPL